VVEGAGCVSWRGGFCLGLIVVGLRAGRLAARVVAAAVVLVFPLALNAMPPCSVAGFFLAAGMLLAVLPVAVLAFADRVCRVRVGLDGESITVGLGSCGRLRVSLDAVVSARVVDSVRPVARLLGTSVPGVFYAGYYAFRGGRGYMFSERLERLVELRLRDGTVVYLGGNAVEELAGLFGRRGAATPAGDGGGGGLRVESRVGGRLLRVLALILAAYMALGLLLYPLLPERVPTHFNARWEPDSWGTRMEALAIYYGIGGIAAALTILGHRMAARRDPLGTMLLPPLTMGLYMLGIGIILLESKLCPTTPLSG